MADEITPNEPSRPFVHEADVERITNTVIAKKGLVSRTDVVKIAREQAELVFSEHADMLQSTVNAADGYVRLVEARINTTDGLLTSLRDVINNLRTDISRQDNRTDEHATKFALLEAALTGNGEHSFDGRLKQIEITLAKLPEIIQVAIAVGNEPVANSLTQINEEVSRLKQNDEWRSAVEARLKDTIGLVRGAAKFLISPAGLKLLAALGGSAGLGAVIASILKALGGS